MRPTDVPGPPIGNAVTGWQPPPVPPAKPLIGQHCRIESLKSSAHGDALFDAWQGDDAMRWVYLGGRPFDDRSGCHRWLDERGASHDPCFMAIVERDSGRALGTAAWLNILPAHGTIELGHLSFSTAMARRRMATEALHLLIRHAFALGYRRLEWKCDALNTPSRRAAERLGFSFEGIFRQHRVVRGHNRDTAWFSLLDVEWPLLSPAFERWLADDNFDAAGHQRLSLSVLTASALQKE